MSVSVETVLAQALCDSDYRMAKHLGAHEENPTWNSSNQLRREVYINRAKDAIETLKAAGYEIMKSGEA